MIFKIPGIKNILRFILFSVLSNMAFAESMDGKKIAFDRSKGNCLACHAIDDGEMPGNIAPPLLAMKARFPDRAVLRSQIWDATSKNPITTMPPFGRHHILSDADIDKIIDYLYTL